MRHRVDGRKLKRTASHRKALLQSLATSLLRHKRIRTTEAKAKEASRFTEAIITRAKRASLAEQGGSGTDIHARRVVARDINDGDIVHELFSEIAAKVAGRPGGYTRVVKIGRRLGDGARVAIIELVDYNMERDDSAARSRSKSAMSRAERVARSRAKQAAKPQPATPAAAAPAAAPVAEAPVVEEALVEAPVDEQPVVEEAVAEAPAANEAASGTEETGETAAEGDEAKPA